MDSRLVLVNRYEVLRFYDDPDPTERGVHAAAINAVAGEELGLALLVHCLRSSDIDARILPGSCTTGKRKGHRLDGWVQTTQVAYQVEVKNWSSHSLGGSTLALDASPDEAEKYRRKLWGEYWTGSTFRDAPAAKVLERMQPPETCGVVEPLIVFWPSMHPDGEPDPLFVVPLEGHPFDHVTVFSMSAYLRGLTGDTVELRLPNTVQRLAILGRLFGI